MRESFRSSYCAHRHYLDTGWPIGHECYVIPPAALIAERDGDLSTANRVFRETRDAAGRPPKVKGREPKRT